MSNNKQSLVKGSKWRDTETQRVYTVLSSASVVATGAQMVMYADGAATMMMPEERFLKICQPISPQ